MGLKVESLGTETNYSRAPMAKGLLSDGDKGIAVKFRLRPTTEKSPQEEIIAPRDLSAELPERLNKGALDFAFEVQKYRDPGTTPIEDATVSLGGDESFIHLATLSIPKEAENDLAHANGINFNPFHISKDHFRLLSSMNRYRKVVYEASLQARNG